PPAGGSAGRAFDDPEAAGSLQGNSGPAPGRRDVRSRDSRTDRTYSRIRARESAPRNETSEGKVGREGGFMSDDYLWDGSGEPDPEVERLERLLERFKHERPVPELARTVRAGAGRPRRLVPWLAAAAAAL